MADLIDSEAGMKARHVLIIADSCSSGAMTGMTRRKDDDAVQKVPSATSFSWAIKMPVQAIAAAHFFYLCSQKRPEIRTIDGPLFKGIKVVIVGGGYSAATEAASHEKHRSP